MKYIYFVSYAYDGGFGRFQVTRDEPIRSIEDIAAIEKEHDETTPFVRTVILNYQFMDSREG